MSKVTIGLIQLETRLGDKEYNLALAQEKVREAASQGAPFPSRFPDRRSSAPLQRLLYSCYLLLIFSGSAA